MFRVGSPSTRIVFRSNRGDSMMLAIAALAALIHTAPPGASFPLAALALGAPTLEATGTLGLGRIFHSATILPDGRVLIAGGSSDTLNGAPTATCEIFDPRTGRFAPTGALNDARIYHAGVLLTDGRVLVMGGAFGGANRQWRNSAEIFDARSGAWTRVAQMQSARFFHTATLLRDGRVLVSGGSANPPVGPPEIYDPAADT